MARFKNSEAASSGRPKKIFAAAAAMAVCCLWQGASPGAFGQAAGLQGQNAGPAATPEYHRPHQHEHDPAKEEGPGREGSARLTIPDVTLLDQNGRAVRFYTDLVKGKVVVINFIFTSCKVVCPPLGANFAKLQSVAGGRIGKDVHLISISTDPETDTPAQLRAWAERFGAKPGWTLVTGEKAQVDRLLLALNRDVARKGEHSAVVLVGSDPRGRWRQAYGLASPGRLLEMADEISR